MSSMFPPRAQSGNYEGVGHFVRLKDGESVTGVFLGKPEQVFVIGFGATAQVVGPNQGGKRKFRVNFVIKENNNYVARIWEFGPQVYDQLSGFEKGGWDLSKSALTISRTGTTKENTRYTVTPNPTPPSEIALKAINALTPLDLNPKPQVAPPQGQTGNEEF